MAENLTCPTQDGLPVTRNSAKGFLDELTPIAEYMVIEMLKNRMSPAVAEMQRLNGKMPNDFISKAEQSVIEGLLKLGAPWSGWGHAIKIQNQMAAMAIWTSLVAQARIWDHKPVISSCFHPRDPDRQEFHAWGDRRYFYDIWSNIHYGYVGIAAGFSLSMLLSGAGGEQVGSTLSDKRLSWQSSHHANGFFESLDDENDRKAILLGAQLFYKYAGGLSAKILLDSIVNGDLKYRLAEPSK